MKAVAAVLGVALTGVPAPAHEITWSKIFAAQDAREVRLLQNGATLAQVAPAAFDPASQCRLALRVVDSATGETVPALVRVTDSAGRSLALPGLMSRGLQLRANHPARFWYIVDGAAELRLPRAELVVEAFSGLETEMTTVRLDLRQQTDAQRSIALRRFHSAVAGGWHGGNTHLHLRNLSRAQAEEYLRTVPRADGLELVFVSYLERAGEDATYITNEFKRVDLVALQRPGLRFGHGEEHRHNFGTGGEGYGHVMFLELPELILPASIGSGITKAGPDYPPLRAGIERARAQGATIVWCHNVFGFEHAPNWLAGRIDAHNIFDGGSHGSYRDTFYQLLDVGLKVPFSAGTDWFIYDFSRAYVRAPAAPDAGAWLQALRAGRSFITNGPLLELAAGSREIGDTIEFSSEGGRQPVRARAVGRGDFRELQLVHNGTVVARATARAEGGHFVAELSTTLEVSASGWVAARVAGGSQDDDGPVIAPPALPVPRAGVVTNEMNEPLFAHTSPIYLEVAGRPRFDPAAARALIERMEAGLRAIEAKGKFDSAPQRDEVRRPYREAIAGLRERLK